jgi:hypothetical protein
MNQEEFTGLSRRIHFNNSSGVGVTKRFSYEFQLKEISKYKNINEKSVEDFGHRPRKPGGWKEDQLPKHED